MAKKKKETNLNEEIVAPNDAELHEECLTGDCDGCEDCKTKTVEKVVAPGDTIIKIEVKHGCRVVVDGKFYNRNSILTVAASKVVGQERKYKVLENG